MKQENNTVRSNVGDGVDVGTCTCVIVFVTLDCLVFYRGGDLSYILYINIHIDYCRADPTYIIVLGSG